LLFPQPPLLALQALQLSVVAQLRASVQAQQGLLAWV
jgi:hypothetical protein